MNPNQRHDIQLDGLSTKSTFLLKLFDGICYQDYGENKQNNTIVYNHNVTATQLKLFPVNLGFPSMSI